MAFNDNTLWYNGSNLPNRSVPNKLENDSCLPSSVKIEDSTGEIEILNDHASEPHLEYIGSRLRPIVQDARSIMLEPKVYSARGLVAIYLHPKQSLLDFKITRSISAPNLSSLSKVKELDSKSNLSSLATVDDLAHQADEDIPYCVVTHGDLLVKAIRNLDIEACRALLIKYPQCVHAPKEIYGPLETIIGNFPPAESDPTPALDILKLLIAHGANLNEKCRPHRETHGWMLHKAIIKRSSIALICLLENGARVEGSGALHAAAATNWIDGLEIVLKHGADVNECLSDRVTFDGHEILSNDGESPLYYAARRGRKESFLWLLEHGAKFTDGNYMMELAVSKGNAGLADWIREHMEADSATDEMEVSEEESEISEEEPVLKRKRHVSEEIFSNSKRFRGE